MSLDNSPVFKLIDRRIACSNSRFDICLDTLEAANGTRIDDFLIVRPKVVTAENVAGVLVLPESEGKIGLMRGHRHQLDGIVWQGPAGFVETGEEGCETALRELVEETGFGCPRENLVALGSMLPDAGLVQGRVALFVARDVTPGDCFLDEAEPGTGGLTWLTPQDLLDILKNESNIGGSTLVAGFRYLTLIGHPGFAGESQ